MENWELKMFWEKLGMVLVSGDWSLLMLFLLYTALAPLKRLLPLLRHSYWSVMLNSWLVKPLVLPGEISILFSIGL